jgi:uncharacterized membrane protein YccC
MSDAAADPQGAGAARIAGSLAAAAGPALFALRLWASVCLALYAAFRLELSEPSWAATTAALVCQPQLGASLRKGSFRLIGTIVGGVAIVVIAALFPQARVGFLVSLSLWAAACGFAGAMLKNFAAYGAGLAGFTAAVIAGDILGPTGSASDQVGTFALFRVVEISVGIVSAGIVLALTDLGGARRRLGAEFAAVATAAFSGFAASAAASGQDEAATRPARRELIRRVIALDPMIDTAIGEASDLRYRSRLLQAGMGGMIWTISAWRTLALHRERDTDPGGRDGAAAIGQKLIGLSKAFEAGEGAARMRDACGAAVRDMARIDSVSPSAQLLADAAANGLIGTARALNGLTLIVDPGRTRREDALAALHVPDWLPPAIFAVRAFLTVGIVSLFWIVTAWPSGPLAIAFATVAAVIFPLQGDRAASIAMTFLLGCVLSATVAAIVVLGILPRVVGFEELGLTLGLVLFPLGVLIAWPAQPVFFTAAAINFVPLLSLANVMHLDAAQFFNNALAILGGLAAGLILIVLLPPLSPAIRTRRLLAFALDDVRKTALGRRRWTGRQWADRVFARMVALPDEAEPDERARMASALATGMRIIRLRRVATRFVSGEALDAALAPLGEGRVPEALAGLEALDRELTTATPHAKIVRRLRAAVLALSEELAAYAGFYGHGGRE